MQRNINSNLRYVQAGSNKENGEPSIFQKIICGVIGNIPIKTEECI